MYLNSSVERGAGKLVVVFRVDDYLHDIVRVSLKHLSACPFSVPVPQFDQHVVYKKRYTSIKYDNQCMQLVKLKVLKAHYAFNLTYIYNVFILQMC